MNFDHIRDHSHTIGTRRYFRYRPDDWRVVCATCGNGGSVIHKTREAAGPIPCFLSYTFLGRSWCMRVKRRQRWAGTYATARQLRKQGIGLATSLLLLTGRVI